jgi:flagellar protein FlbD
MINVTRLRGEPIVVNAELLETVEATPDTVLTMTTGQQFVVRESVEEVVRRVIAYRRAVRRRGCQE